MTSESLEEELLGQEPRLALLSFDADTAWDIGRTLRSLAAERHPGRPIYISITQAGTDKPMFFTRTVGVTPSQMSRLEDIQNAVKSLEMSTWRADHCCGGNTEKYIGQCYPGGWPIRVRQVEGIVAVLVVHGLGYKLASDGSVETTQFEYRGKGGACTAASLDHDLIIDALKLVLNQQ